MNYLISFFNCSKFSMNPSEIWKHQLFIVHYHELPSNVHSLSGLLGHFLLLLNVSDNKRKDYISI